VVEIRRVRYSQRINETSCKPKIEGRQQVAAEHRKARSANNFDIKIQALGNQFSTGGQGQKSSFIIQHDALIFALPLEIVLIVNAI